MDGRHAVASAWREGRSWSQGNVSTNGHDLFSYGHEVGTTISGVKVARCCHYSVTTAKHCSAFKGVADVVWHCPDHSRAACVCCRGSLAESSVAPQCDEPFYGDYLDDVPTTAPNVLCTKCGHEAFYLGAPPVLPYVCDPCADTHLATSCRGVDRTGIAGQP